MWAKQRSQDAGGRDPFKVCGPERRGDMNLPVLYGPWLPKINPPADIFGQSVLLLAPPATFSIFFFLLFTCHQLLLFPLCLLDNIFSVAAITNDH